MNENPQLDAKYTRLANDILEELSRTNITKTEWRVLMCLFRKTYGYHKKEDWISGSQIAKMTGINKCHVSRAISLLCDRKMVTKRGNKTGFNKYTSQWIELPNGVTNHEVTKRGLKVTKRGNRELPNGVHTKETITKETIQKKTADAVFDKFEEVTSIKVLSRHKKRVSAVKRACGVFTDEQIISAWENMTKNTFLNGANEGRKKYLTIDYALRLEKIEEHIPPELL